MAFIDKSNLLEAIDLETLDDVLEQDDSKVAPAVLKGIEMMKSYLNPRYDTATIFDDSNPSKSPLIIMYLVDITLYVLHKSISPDNIPELRKELYTEAKEWLEKCADGFISPDLDIKDEDENMPIRFGSGDKQENYY